MALVDSHWWAAPRRCPSYAQQYNYIPCGRSNERPYGWDEVGMFNNTLIIIRLNDACGRSNERPYVWDAVRMIDDCAVGGHCKRVSRRPAAYAQQYNYTLNVGTYLGASASEEQSNDKQWNTNTVRIARRCTFVSLNSHHGYHQSCCPLSRKAIRPRITVARAAASLMHSKGKPMTNVLPVLLL